MLNRRLFVGLAMALTAFSSMHAHAQSGNEVIVGQIGPFTGLPAGDAKWLNEGLSAAFTEANSKGGIGGRPIKLITLDDGYNYDGFMASLNKLLPYKPVAILTPVGSSTLKGILDNKVLDRHDVVILNAVPGLEAIRKPGHSRLFHVRESDERQVHRVVAHAYTMAMQNLAVLYQDIPIGSSGLQSTKNAVSARGGGLSVLEFESSIDPKALAAVAKKLVAEQPQATLVIGNPKFMADGVAVLRGQGMKSPIFSLSYLPPDVLYKLAGESARGVGIVQTYPNAMGQGTPLQRQFRAAMQLANPTLTSYNAFHMEGYITGRIFVEAARFARTLTPTGLAEALKSMGPIDVGGFSVNFAHSNEGGKWLDIGVVTAEGKLRF